MMNNAKMKKRCLTGRLISLVMTVAMLLAMMSLFSSCGEKDDYVPGSHELGTTGISVYPEMVKVDLEYGSKDLGFPLNFVSANLLSEDKIKFVRLEGENIDYFEKTAMTRRQLEDVTDVEINGKYLYSYSFKSDIDIDYFTPKQMQPPDIWDIRIDTVVISIDGEEYPIKLVNPVKYKYHYNDNGYNDIYGNHMYGPIMIFTFNLTGRYPTNIYNYTSDILVKDFYFSDFLDVTSKQLYFQGAYLGELTGDKQYPISKRTAGGGSWGTVYFNAAYPKNSKGTDFDYILCTSVLEYQIEGDDTVYKMQFPFNAQGLGNRETAEKLLAYVDTLG